jgi:AraC-like DNA-binding protein
MVYPFKIPKRPNNNLVLQIDKTNKFYNKLHQHEEIQLSYIISGEGTLILGNSVTNFTSGDLIGIGSNIPHLFKSSDSSFTSTSHMISLFFSKDAFGKDFFNSPEMDYVKPIFNSLPQGLKIKDSDGSLHNHFSSFKNSNKFELLIGLLELLRYLVKNEKQYLSEKKYYSKISDYQGQRLQVVIDFVLNNFSDPIALDDVAKKIPMGKNSFCRFFKQRTNKTFFEFLAEIRIQHACNLLGENIDMPINEIALKSGYQTISNFNRQFKKIKGTYPKSYRELLF